MSPVKNKTWIKICGVTSIEDALAAAECGADAVGFVFAESKRRIVPTNAKAIVRALRSNVMSVGVFMNEKPETVQQIADAVGLDAVQLHGAESVGDCQKINRKVIKRFAVRPGDTAPVLVSRMKAYPVFACLLDPGAGDGVPFDWKAAMGIPLRLIVAGGLSPENVKEVIQLLNPFGVDISTGVEREPGKKDFAKVQKFIEEVRNAQHIF